MKEFICPSWISKKLSDIICADVRGVEEGKTAEEQVGTARERRQRQMLTMSRTEEEEKQSQKPRMTEKHQQRKSQVLRQRQQ